MEMKKKDTRFYTKNSETKEQARERLKITKETRKEARELKEEIYFKTGNEFSYKMHSLKAEPDKLIKIEKKDPIFTQRKVVQLNFEILRIEKKLRKMMPIFKVNKIKFGSQGKIKEVKSKSEYKANDRKVVLLKNYLKKLYSAKNDLL
ncbi:hypothetical protein M153_1213000624 [Pseudoloma neurophilia]|uniref:Uncharacterized protein n=1 Tax=Pseudoloma neurophilia TaxID=146866 RepID=A0A0R0LV54_9MICR|nr:hypothetical protein M153_1213000624 [Pseudoloma neurophilia]